MISFLFRTVLLCLIGLPTLHAEVSLEIDARFGDHMVLQQNKTTRLTGRATPKAVVSIQFGEQNQTAAVNDDGRWGIDLAVSAANAEPQSLTASATLGEETTEIVLSDLLVGEVWMCSGQSNMARTLDRTANLDQAAAHPKIRLFRHVMDTSTEPLDSVEGEWETCTPETAALFSGVGYLFGQELAANLDVPIGLIATAWGGKLVEAYTSREMLESVPEAAALLDEWRSKDEAYDLEMAVQAYEKALEAWRTQVAAIKASDNPKAKLPRRPVQKIQPMLEPHAPSAIYNQAIAPWTDTAIAGAIWYQGESNRMRAHQYESLLPAMIRDWRAQWDDEFPFYFVQLAAFRDQPGEPVEDSIWAELQNAQRLTLQKVENTGMAVANDIGDRDDIHPADKRGVAHRLALLALDRTYGKAVGPSSGPLYKGASVEGAEITVSFDEIGEGLKLSGGETLGGFEIAGDNRQFVPAQARIAKSGREVVVSSPEVSEPKAVRYAWEGFPEDANLVNSAGLPTSVFRTADWPLTTEGRFTFASMMAMNYAFGLDAQHQRFEETGWEVLFNGRDLTGWKNPYDFGEATVVDGEIHLKSDKKFFLVSEAEYDDFTLMVDIHLPEGQANSGVMFRAHVEPGKVFGYQAECDGSDRRWSGGLYDEGRRKWLWPSKTGNTGDEAFLAHEAESQAHFQKPEVRGALRRNDWNTYKITCRGDNIRIEVNGVLTTQITDDLDSSGPIGIQHHGEEGQTYRFRRIILKPL